MQIRVAAGALPDARLQGMVLQATLQLSGLQPFSATQLPSRRSRGMLSLSKLCCSYKQQPKLERLSSV